MRFKLNVDLDNAAFEQDGPNELSRILINVAMQIEDEVISTGSNSTFHQNVKDTNGNNVGTYVFEDEPKEKEYTTVSSSERRRLERSLKSKKEKQLIDKQLSDPEYMEKVKFAVYKGLIYKNIFWSTYDNESSLRENCITAGNLVVYEILGLYHTDKEAQQAWENFKRNDRQGA